jgi:hypothetical protein
MHEAEMNDMKDAGKNGSSGTMMEQWIAQEVFRHPEQLAASFMNAPNVGVAISDTQFRFRGVNEALAAMNGRPNTLGKLWAIFWAA